MADLGWSRYIAQQEAAHEMACLRAAAKHGIEPNLADECDDGSHNCPTCPWREINSLNKKE